MTAFTVGGAALVPSASREEAYASFVDRAVRERFEAWKAEPLTWHPVQGGKRPLIAWDDDITVDLGADPDGSRFREIADRMMTGRYYPPHVIVFHRETDAPMVPGERVLQETHLAFVRLWSMVEIFLADRGDDFCRIGYVTTRRHHGRGIWQAHLTRNEGKLSLRVFSMAGPQSMWFWIGLPIARWKQLWSREQAIKSFREVGQ